jgi:hypothetical protein
MTHLFILQRVFYVIFFSSYCSLCFNVGEERLMGTSCPPMCRVFQPSRRAGDILSPKGINKLIFVMVTRCVLFVIGTGFSGCQASDQVLAIKYGRGGKSKASSWAVDVT